MGSNLSIAMGETHGKGNYDNGFYDPERVELLD
jgi:hypothetical protein